MNARPSLPLLLMLMTVLAGASFSCDKKESTSAAAGGSPGTQPSAPTPGAPPAPTATQALPYELKQMGAATIAQFENWKTVPVKDDASGSILAMGPEGHEKEFDLTVFISAPGSPQDVDQLFQVGPQIVRQAAPGLS